MSGVRRLLPLSGFVALALALTWPLPLHLATHFTGSPGGDTGVYIWNLWVFSHELIGHHHWPFLTEHIFAASTGANLSAHNYTVLADLLAVPLLGALGIVRTFNVIYIALVFSSGYATYLLARRLIGSESAAWMAGAAFAASPYLIACGTAHFSLAAAAPLPLFLLFVLRALDNGRARDAVLAGAMMGIAGYCDVYYTIYCLLMGAFLVAHHVWTIVPASGTVPVSRQRLLRAVHVVLVAGAAAIAWRLVHGEAVFALFGRTVSFRTLYTPVLVLTVLLLVRQQLIWRLRLRRRPESRRTAGLAGLMVAAGAGAAIVLAPVIIGLIEQLMTGSFPSAPLNWRSSPPGLDVVDLFVLNPNHPWLGGPGLQWIRRHGPLAYPEFVGSLPLTALAVIALALKRDPRSIPRVWIAFTVAFALLSLGPFVHVFGLNTYVPGPWWILRAVPIVNLARSPSRIVMVAALGVALMFGYALAALRQQWPSRGALVSAVASCLLAFELLPVPRPLFDASVPAVYDVIRRDKNPDVLVLELPGGVRDGTSSIGDFSASAQYFQTRHEKPLIGGYQSRVSDRDKRVILESPVLAALFSLSAGQAVRPELAANAWNARRRFLRRSCLGYVVFESARTSPELRDFAVRLLDLRPVADAGGRALFAPASRTADEPCAIGNITRLRGIRF